jgi:hypothetical protein
VIALGFSSSASWDRLGMRITWPQKGTKTHQKVSDWLSFPYLGACQP